MGVGKSVQIDTSQITYIVQKQISNQTEEIQTVNCSSQIQTSDIMFEGIQRRQSETKNINHKEQLSQKKIIIEQQEIWQEQTNKQPSPLEVIQVNSNKIQQVIEVKNTNQSSERSKYETDAMQVQQVYGQLLSNFIPAVEIKLIKKQEYKRTLILWLKANYNRERQKERDKVLINEGFRVFSHDDIALIFKRFGERTNEEMRLSTLVLFSFSDYYNNEETIKELYEYFVRTNLLKNIYLVKPPQIETYRRFLNNISINKQIIQFSYPIESVKLKILDLQLSQFSHSCNFITFRYWHGRKELSQMIQKSDPYRSARIKTYINVFGLVKIGQLLIKRISESTQTFKKLIYQYCVFQDAYVSGSSLANKQSMRDYLSRIGLKLLQDPIKFYFTECHRTLINRTIKFNGDNLQNMSHIILPVALIYSQIREDYIKEMEGKKYKNQFICYFQQELSDSQFQELQLGAIVTNTGFFKAQLRPIQNGSSNSFGNTIFAIYISSKKMCLEFDNGYCFHNNSGISEQELKEQDISQQRWTLNREKQGGEKSQSKNFTGFNCVLFNLLNTFKIKNRRFDKVKNKNVIEMQYGYIAHQKQLRNIENYIPEQKNWITYSPIYQNYSVPVDYRSLVTYQSNIQILEQITDYGDCFSLTSQYKAAIRYYDQLFIRNKTEMKSNSLILGQIQEKKGLNLQLMGSHKAAIDHYYQAFGFIHQGTISVELQRIYERTLSLLLKEKDYDVLLRFGENMIKNAIVQNNLNSYTPQFQLKLHYLLALAYFQRTISQFNCVSIESRVEYQFKKCLELVEVLGEYNQVVAGFYYVLGKHYLILQNALQGLGYLNKSLLILKNILTQHHPRLCEIYEYLSVGFVEMHDYERALNQIEQAIGLYQFYYQKDYVKLVPCFQIKGKIHYLLGNTNQSLKAFQKEINTLSVLKYKNISVETIRTVGYLNYDFIGIFNNFESKQLNPYFDHHFRLVKTFICKTYARMYRARLLLQQYQYQQSIKQLSSAELLSKQEFGQNNSICIEIKKMICDNWLQKFDWRQAQKISKQIGILINKNKLHNKYQNVVYQQLLGRVYQCSGNFNQSYLCYSKGRELAFRVMSRNNIDFCLLVDLVGKIAIKANKIKQARTYFAESEQIRTRMLEEATLNRYRVMLFGADFQQYVRNIRLGLCYSKQNEGRMCLAKQDIQQAIKYYKICIAQAIELLGEFHQYTAHLQKQLGKLLLQKQETRFLALNCFNIAFSVYQAMRFVPVIDLIDLYIGIARVQQYQNQLGVCIEWIGKAILLLRKSGKMEKEYERCIERFLSIVELIVNHENDNYWKIAYFTISNVFESEKSQYLTNAERNRQKVSFSSIQKEVSFNIIKIIECSQSLREKIEKELDKREDEKSNDQLIEDLKDKDIVNVQLIKQKSKRRKMKREYLKRD